MTAHLRPNDIETILEVLDGWTGKLTWPALVDRIERRLHRRYTRLTLSKKSRIADSYAQIKSRLAIQQGVENKPSNAESQVVERLKSEKLRFSLENKKLLEQHLRWRYNAHLHGLTLEVLDKPMPSVSRSTSML